MTAARLGRATSQCQPFGFDVSPALVIVHQALLVALWHWLLVPADLRGNILQLHAPRALLQGLRLALLDLIRWHAADRERDSLLVAIPQDHHRDVFAHWRGSNQRGQIVRTLDLLAIKSDNHVTALEP